MTTKSDRNTPYVEAKAAGLVPNAYLPTTDEVLAVYEAKFKHNNKEAVKADFGKLDWSLVPFEALEGMVNVLEFGAKKYARHNWQEGGGFEWTRTLAACLRHIFAFMRGEDNDPESGLSHISHAQCNLLFIAYYIRNKGKFNKDNRNVR